MFFLKIADRLQSVKPSATLAINARAIELQKQGQSIVKFGTGEPDCDTPEHIKKAAIEAIAGGFTKYTATGGFFELKEAIVAKLFRENGISCPVGAKNVLVSNGGKQALFNALMALLNPGDEVLVATPYWVSYSDMIELTGAKARFIDTRTNNFQLTASMLATAYRLECKVLILNSPANPTGAVIDNAEIVAIAEFARAKNLFVISDEVYEHFFYGAEKPLSIASLPEMFERTLTVNAVSKTYAMTGWRIGFCAGPELLISAMDTLQGHSTSNPCSIAQKAALAALNGPQAPVNEILKNFRRRRDLLANLLAEIPDLKMRLPQGAFYAFIDVSRHFTNQMPDSVTFTRELLEKAGVAVVPGSAFGEAGEGFIRISYATSDSEIEEGFRRLKNFIQNLPAR